MYDLAEVRTATDAWWKGLCAALNRAGVPDVPEVLTRGPDPRQWWCAPDLLFAQTCGYPLTHALAGVVRLVATPAYSAPGCDGALYRSVIVVAADSPVRGLGDLRGAVGAFNGRDSQSGYNALRASLAPHARDGRFLARVVETGEHVRSVAAVITGEADVCAVDCVTHALLARYRPAALEGSRVLACTGAAPALPYVTRGTASEDDLRRLRAGLRAALADPDLAGAREALLIAGAEVLPESAYRRIVEMESDARAAGYPELC